MQAKTPDPEGHDELRLTSEQEAERKRRQRHRSLAIAAVLVALAVLFYIVTMIQISNNLGGTAQ